MNGDDRPDERGDFRTEDSETRRRLDELLSLLVERRRRDVLYFVTSTGVTDIETLAKELAAKSEGVPVDDVPDGMREEVRVHLVHTDLPKLADANAIEFDPRSEAIRCRDLPPILEGLVESCREIEAE